MVRTDEFPLPPHPFIRAALKTTTERIALELYTPQKHAPAWGEFEWRVAMTVAAMHGVSGMLAGRLHWQGPEVWQAFLTEQLHQGKLRQQRTRQLLDQLDLAAVQAQLPLIALKGSELLNLHLYAPGERPMSDIDLLCREHDFEAAGRFIEAIGYQAGPRSWKHLEYIPVGVGKDRAFGEHIQNPTKIELHSRIAERLPIREVVITDQLFPRNAQAGLNPYPSLAALMRHLLLHAAGNVCQEGIRLIHLHDIAALAGRMHAHDWDELLHTAAWWMGPPLAFAERCFPGRIPPGSLKRAASLSPPLLRRSSARYNLAEHSVSSGSTPIITGLAWSHSMAEAGSCIVRRLYPGHDATALREHAALSQHPAIPSSWANTPRWKKGLLILAGGIPRAGTLYHIRRALNYRPGDPVAS